MTRRSPNPILIFQAAMAKLEASTSRKSWLSATRPTMPRLPARPACARSVSDVAASQKQGFAMQAASQFMMAQLTCWRDTMSQRSLGAKSDAGGGNAPWRHGAILRVGAALPLSTTAIPPESRPARDRSHPLACLLSRRRPAAIATSNDQKREVCRNPKAS
jgi:hypothetical protein